MKKKTKKTISVLAGLVVIAGLGIAGYLLWLRPPAASEKPTPRSLSVFLTKPLISSQGLVGEPMPVSAEAVSTYPIQSLELYVDDVLMDRTNAPGPDMRQLNGLWEWTPAVEGEHMLTARAIDGKGQIVNSNFIRLKINPAGPAGGRVILSREGDTLALFSQSTGIPLTDLEGANPSTDPSAPLQAGQPISLPGSMGGATPPGQPQIEPGNPNPEPPPPPPPPGPESPPSAPFVAGSVEGCNANLEILPGDTTATGYRLYVVPPGALEPEELGTFGPLASIDDRHAFTHSNLFGSYVYFTEAFNDFGMAQSQTITLNINKDDCAQNGKKSANVKLISGYGLDEAYCYVTNIGTNTHVRLPLPPDTFIPPMDPAALKQWGEEWIPGIQLAARTGYDLGPYLPALYLNNPAGATLFFECWGWASGKLHNLGTAQKTFTANDLHKVVVIEGKDYQVVGVFGDSSAKIGDKTIILPVPINFYTTGNPEECAKFDFTSFGLANCQQFIKNGWAAFTWSVILPKCPAGTQNTCTAVNDIDGFRIYRQTVPNPTFAYGIEGGLQVFNGFVPWPQYLECANLDPTLVNECLNNNPPCYTVRSYKGALQSKDSNLWCLGDKDKTTGSKTIILSPSSIGNSLIESGYGDTGFTGPSEAAKQAGPSDNGEIAVGYYEQSGDEWSLYWDYWGRFMFDLSPVMGKPITSARLTFTKAGSTHKLGFNDVGGYDCTRSLGVSKTDVFWVGYKQSNSGIPQTMLYKPLGNNAGQTGDFEFDVTDAVKAWSQGTKVNTGFVLDGRDTVWPAPAVTNRCYNYFNNFKLEITYFPNP